ncbi:MAG: hypothetical protein P8Q97_09755 [Myxococcota bacterium]|jgi:hypothetical protein|nr:hypothetical protein [Myxococcota bacterium]
MLWVSWLLILACYGWFILGAMGSGPPIGHDEFIHARVPWRALGFVWLGAGLGLAALAKRRTLLSATSFGLQVLLVAFFSSYFLQGSFLPDHAVALEVGDAFPSYALLDQDEVVHSRDSNEPREPELYIFYRGDW